MLLKEKTNVLDGYMELTVQFGFVTFFSGIFPLAGLLSMISNAIQIKSQTSNLIYMKRYKAEISNGIGNFHQCLSILSQLSIMVSAGILYFTSSIFKNMFTGKVVSGNEV
jgi:hypothetical protein